MIMVEIKENNMIIFNKKRDNQRQRLKNMKLNLIK